jgi:hypothetical protein
MCQLSNSNDEMSAAAAMMKCEGRYAMLFDERPLAQDEADA